MPPRAAPFGHPLRYTGHLAKIWGFGKFASDLTVGPHPLKFGHLDFCHSGMKRVVGLVVAVGPNPPVPPSCFCVIDILRTVSKTSRKSLTGYRERW